MKDKMEEKTILGVSITSATKEEVLEYILKGLEKQRRKYYIVTPNPELLVLAHKSQEYKNVLNRAELALCDGIGVLWASRLLGKSLKERVTGIDFIQYLCDKVSEKPITVGFLGGGPSVAKKTAECLKNKYPGLKVAFALGEWHDNLSVDILFVAFGSPKQEIWIARNLDRLRAKIVVGVGGSFDFISGTTVRAPVLIQNFGLEWLYRLIRQPWRLKRQLALIEFIFLVLKEKIAS